MAMDLLRLIAASPLPAISHDPEEIAAIKALRSAGLLIALTPATESAPALAAKECAMILAITEKGRRALWDFAFRVCSVTPKNAPPMSAEASSPVAATQSLPVKYTKRS